MSACVRDKEFLCRFLEFIRRVLREFLGEIERERGGAFRFGG